MTKAIEQAGWYKKKHPVIDEYLKTVKQIEKQVAGQGFLYRPGFLGQEITQIERALKSKLSDINYGIAAQAVERELAQTGHDYGILYKEARIAWELEKAQTLADLEREFALLKQHRQLEDDELTNLKIETDLRSLVLLSAKVALEETMEDLRQEQAGLQLQALPYETQLATGRLATAQAKLAVIPYVQEIIEAQEDLLVVEASNADRKTALMTEKELLIDKKQDLADTKTGYADKLKLLIEAKTGLLGDRNAIVAAMSDLLSAKTVNAELLLNQMETLDEEIGVRLEFALAKRALIPKHLEKAAAWDSYLQQLILYIDIQDRIAAVKEQIADLEEDETDIKEDIMQKEIEKLALDQLLQAARIALAELRLTGEESIIEAKLAALWEKAAGDQEIYERKRTAESRVMSEKLDMEKYVHSVGLASSEEVTDISVDAQVDGILDSAAWAALAKQGTANAGANARITSKLFHTLALG